MVERIHGKDEVTSSSLVEGSDQRLQDFNRGPLIRNRLVVQWLEQGSPKPQMRVRSSPGLRIYIRYIIDMLKFLKESRDELRKVVWPSREEVLNSTIVVLAVVALVSVFLFLIDVAFDSIFEEVVRMGSGG